MAKKTEQRSQCQRYLVESWQPLKEQAASHFLAATLKRPHISIAVMPLKSKLLWASVGARHMDLLAKRYI